MKCFKCDLELEEAFSYSDYYDRIKQNIDAWKKYQGKLYCIECFPSVELLVDKNLDFLE